MLYVLCLLQNEFDKKSQNSTSELVISLFKKIEACKDDSQQRSWFLHEDEDTIANYLTDLIDILVFILIVIQQIVDELYVELLTCF